MLRGAGDLIEVCQHKIHHDPHTTNADGTMSWEEVECLGSCVNAPMVMIHHDTYEDLTAESFGAIVDAFAEGRGASVKPGTQIDRLNASAEGGRTTLIEAPTAMREKFIPPAPPPAPAAAQAPTTAAKPKDVTEESAPAIKGTPAAAKVSEAKAEGERKAANASAKANGEPNAAMRPTATGAESPAGKIDGGKAPGKAKKSAADETPAVVAPAAPATQVNPVAEKGSEAPLFAAPAGPADDLKLISGVGPVLEGRLNALGITKWSQVATLSADDIAKVEGSLNFKGRVARDNWLAQAEVLARGGEAEYVRVFGKKPR
jgi:NADH-quinone oxidoreductase subunit E